MRCIINKNLSIKKIDTELFILDRHNAIIHTFNETGTFIWENLIQGFCLLEITENLIQKYQVSNEQAVNDIEEYIQLLQEKELITISES